MFAPVAAGAQTNAAAAAPAGAPVATPIGNPASWFPADAYPPEAKAAGIQGRTEFKLELDPQGRITECDIAKSSGSPLLDSTTCALLVTNARFKPARDASGRAVPGTWQSAMVWQLAAAAPDTLEGFSGQSGKSPAEIYNDSVSAEQKQAQQAQDQQQGGGSNDDQ
ncbi:MAG: energy transducer TonB [Sphingomonas sp.]